MAVWEVIPYLCAAIVLLLATSAGISGMLAGRAHGRTSIGWIIWPIYGFIVAAFSLWVTFPLGLFAVGLLAPVLSHNLAWAWSLYVLGPEESLERQARLVMRGNRWGYALTSLAAVLLRSSPGLLLVLSLPSDHPLIFLGWGMLLSSGGTLASVLRVACWPPQSLRDEMARIENEEREDAEAVDDDGWMDSPSRTRER